MSIKRFWITTREKCVLALSPCQCRAQGESFTAGWLVPPHPHTPEVKVSRWGRAGSQRSCVYTLTQHYKYVWVCCVCVLTSGSQEAVIERTPWIRNRSRMLTTQVPVDFRKVFCGAVWIYITVSFLFNPCLHSSRFAVPPSWSILVSTLDKDLLFKPLNKFSLPSSVALPPFSLSFSLMRSHTQNTLTHLHQGEWSTIENAVFSLITAKARSHWVNPQLLCERVFISKNWQWQLPHLPHVEIFIWVVWGMVFKKWKKKKKVTLSSPHTLALNKIKSYSPVWFSSTHSSLFVSYIPSSYSRVDTKSSL